jgi:hypothetical protein
MQWPTSNIASLLLSKANPVCLFLHPLLHPFLSPLPHLFLPRLLFLLLALLFPPHRRWQLALVLPSPMSSLAIPTQTRLS